MNKVKTIKT